MAQRSEERGSSSRAAAENFVDGPRYRPLLRAAFKGDWESAEGFFNRDDDSKTAKITSRLETVLHIAALSAQDQFLEHLVGLFPEHSDAFKEVDCDGRTALHNAVLCGRIRMVKALVKKNSDLIKIADYKGRIPLAISALGGSMYKEIAWFLAKHKGPHDDRPCFADPFDSRYNNPGDDPLNGPLAIDAIIDLTCAGHHDITLFLLTHYRALATARSRRHGDQSVLDVLASMESHFPSGTRLSVLETFIYKCTPVDLNYDPTYEASRNMQMSTSFTSTLVDFVDPTYEASWIMQMLTYCTVLQRITSSAVFLLFRLFRRMLQRITSSTVFILFQVILEDITGSLVFKRITRSLRNATKIVVSKRIYEMKLRHITTIKVATLCCIEISKDRESNLTELFEERGLLAEATVRGISELVKLVFQFFPELIWISPDGMKLMTYVVKYRQERTARLFLKVTSTNESSLVLVPTIEESERMMRAATEYNPTFDATTNVAGAAFQIQRELQWYKAVESWTIPSVRTAKHRETTYWNMFVVNHKELLEKGEKWVKETSNSCMLVSTLIATVLFAAAFTIPGGNDDNTGVPLMLGHDSLLIFAISDALGLFSSVTAILIFLAILTSRYEPQDFLHSLPRKIIVGLLFLFLSLAFMLVAFATTLTIVLDKRVEWVLIPIASLASLLVALFARLQLPLLYQMVKSTYGPSIFRPECIWDEIKYSEVQIHLRRI